MTLDVVILSGGAARRLGGIAKPDLVIGDRTLLETAIAAGREAGADRVVVVGPRRGSADLAVQEDPPGSGPVPAVRRGLAEVTSGWVALLAADLPFVRARHLTGLLAAATGNGTGAVLVDDEDRAQWLVGCWRAAALRDALTAYPGDSLRGLLGPLDPARLRCGDRAWLDCDTPADVARAMQAG
jgi:molybdopterin-guanine dinucleotide biosynthesis protein A